MKRMSKRNLFFLATTSLILGIVLIVSPARDTLAEQESKEGSLKYEFESKQRKLTNLDALKQQFVQLDKQFYEFNQLLPMRIDTGTEAETIKLAAANYDVVVSALVFQPALSLEFHSETPFTLQATADYSHLFYFVYDTFYQPAKAVQLRDFVIERTNGTLSLKLEGAYFAYL